MIDNPFYHLKISGHTDSDGNEEDNKTLSQNRADAIKTWLVDNSYLAIGEDRVTAIGEGSSKPLVKEVTEKDKAINRRVEFEILEETEVEDPDADLWGD